MALIAMAMTICILTHPSMYRRNLSHLLFLIFLFSSYFRLIYYTFAIIILSRVFPFYQVTRSYLSASLRLAFLQSFTHFSQRSL